MKKVSIPAQPSYVEKSVNQDKIKAYFEKGGKAPSIKEQLILKAYEITDTTKVFYESEDVILLYSTDEAGTFLSCFNKTQEHILLELPLATLHLTGEYSAYCVLTAESICVLNETLNLQIPDSGVLLVKLMPINRSL